MKAEQELPEKPEEGELCPVEWNLLFKNFEDAGIVPFTHLISSIMNEELIKFSEYCQTGGML